MPLNLDGPAVDAALQANTLEASATATAHADGSGEAEIAVTRTWTNGWDLTAYAKAWWTGQTVVEVGAGVTVRKTF